MRHGHRQAVAGHIWQTTQRQPIYTNIIMRSTNLPGYPLITHLSLLSVIESAAVFVSVSAPKFMVSLGDIPKRHGLPLIFTKSHSLSLILICWLLLIVSRLITGLALGFYIKLGGKHPVNVVFSNMKKLCQVSTGCPTTVASCWML